MNDYVKGVGEIVWKYVKPILLPLVGALALYTAQYFGLSTAPVVEPAPIVEPAK